MAKRGRKPASNPLKIAQGTRRDRLNRCAPVAPPGIPTCPKHLGREARAEWRRMVPILAQMKVLTLKDGPALAIYCDSFGTWVKAREHLDKFGMTEPTEKGGPKLSPYARIIQDSYATMMRVLSEFGCTPSSLSGIQTTAPVADEDDLTAFLKGGR